MKKPAWTVYNQHNFEMSTTGKMLSGIGEELSSLKAAQKKTQEVLAKLKDAVSVLDKSIKNANTAAVKVVEGQVCLVIHNDYVGLLLICRGLKKCGTKKEKAAAETILSNMDNATGIFQGQYSLQIAGVKPQLIKMKKIRSSFDVIGRTDVLDRIDEYVKKYSTDFSAVIKEVVEERGDTTYKQAKDDVVACLRILKKKVDSFQTEDDKADTEESFVVAANKVWEIAAKSQAASKAARAKAKAEKAKLEQEAKEAAEAEKEREAGI